MSSKFPLGQIVMTRACLEYCVQHEINAFSFISRHARGDWGDLDQQDKKLNELALTEGTRIFSCYREGGEKFYVITEWNRSVTTLMLASDY